MTRDHWWCKVWTDNCWLRAGVHSPLSTRVFCVPGSGSGRVPCRSRGAAVSRALTASPALWLSMDGPRLLDTRKVKWDEDQIHYNSRISECRPNINSDLGFEDMVSNSRKLLIISRRDWFRGIKREGIIVWEYRYWRWLPWLLITWYISALELVTLLHIYNITTICGHRRRSWYYCSRDWSNQSIPALMQISAFACIS